MIPKYFFLTKGVGCHTEQLHSFELALRAAGIQHCNIVKVSSVVPPGCQLISKEEGLKMITPGEITFAVLSQNSSKGPQKQITASIGVAIPSDKRKYGYLSEYHSFGEKGEAAADHAEDLAATMLFTAMGIASDSKTGWDEGKHLFKAGKSTISTMNVTQHAAVTKNQAWTTVIAVAVFIPIAKD